MPLLSDGADAGAILNVDHNSLSVGQKCYLDGLHSLRGLPDTPINRNVDPDSPRQTRSRPCDVAGPHRARPFPSLTIWTQGPDLLAPVYNLQNTRTTRKSDKYAVTRKNHRKSSPTRKHGFEFPKRRVRDQKVDTVFICPFGGIFPINGSS